MARYAALLRAINVGGHTVTMARLRGLFEALPARGVSTYIASGNVLFESAARSRSALEARIERHLASALGYEVATFLRTPTELSAVGSHRAFPPDALAAPGAGIYVMFLKTPLARPARLALTALSTADDVFAVHGTEIYWLRQGRLSDTAIKSSDLARAMGAVSTTMRRLSTVQRLAALATQDDV